MSGATQEAVRGLRVVLFTVFVVVVLGLVGSASVWRLRLASEVNGRLQNLRANGLPTSGAELNAWYPAVPDAENAALVMTQAFALMQTYTDHRSNEIAGFKMPARNVSLTEQERQLLAPYVEMNRAALNRAAQTAGLSRSRYPVDTSPGPNTLMPHLAQIKSLARTAWMEVVLASDFGKTKETTASIASLLKMARTLDEEPLLVSQLVRMAILKMAVASLERRLGAGALTEAEAKELMEVFGETEKPNLLTRALIGERATTIPIFRMSFDEIRRREETDPSDRQLSAKAPLPGRQPALFRLTGFFERDLAYYLKAMETNISLAAQPPPGSLVMTNLGQEFARTAARKKFIICTMMLPALSGVTVRQAETFAALRSATTALAVERFRLGQGRLPESLGELTPRFLPAVPSDPFDGAALKYRRLARGYVIYSVDRDGRDDGGREKPERKKPTDKTTYDITFTVER